MSEAKKARLGNVKQIAVRSRPQQSEINLFAFEVKPKEVTHLQQLLLIEGIADDVSIFTENDMAGLLMSFKNWEKVARFQEWSHYGVKTKQLLTNLRVSCGPIKEGTGYFVYEDAMEILIKRAADEAKPDTEVREASEPTSDDSETGTIEKPHFVHYLIKGVYCGVCGCYHVPIRPKYC